MRRAALLIAATAMMFTAACGNGSSKKNASANATVGSGTTTTVKFSGSSSSKFCDLARSLAQKTKVGPNVDLRKVYQDFDNEAPQIEAAAPAAIKADVETVVAGIRAFKNTLAAVNYDATKLDPASVQALQDPKFTEAATRLSQYYQQVCGVTSSTSSTG